MNSVSYKRASPTPSRRSLSASPTPSDVPTAVSTLLGLTKQLQDVLRLWSTHEASEQQVSDAFVLVGMQFNATVTAFTRHHIDMSDLLSIPDDLRVVLEKCLGEEPSPRVLSHYTPKVRTVLYRLLQGLQRKQAPYWKAVEGSRWVVPAVDEYARYR
ncbi:hypothetical protein PHLGIDRAFT_77366 [Phlebiopsis gigantea 11061_1 CR5-6]|uniref:Aip3p/Bud6 N-terminal domain-containing protein n=1 Tax=Phlebiopsis gigantea (strain 11061_1 CR5-6) TaxID=745531 RepID=A0A0C3S5I9_PHLG1|nr:hypothetical protein PHLGIDRAFT_77366 [Phlebiopsis gigantea 11061_1 CR5-6]